MIIGFTKMSVIRQTLHHNRSVALVRADRAPLLMSVCAVHKISYLTGHSKQKSEKTN